MLPVPLSKIDETLLQRVCSEQWPETQTLEFKAVLPNSDEASRAEFRKDVCALANADGGDIVYGITELSGRAHAIRVIDGNDFEGTLRRLRQIIEARVEPRIHGIQMQHCQLSQGGFVLVVRVPRSLNSPHRCGPPHEHRFVIRTDTQTSDMTYDQLRDSFGRGASLFEKVERFCDDRVQLVESGKSPKRLSSAGWPLAIIHLVPIAGIAGQLAVDVPAIKFDHTILKITDDFSSWIRTTNLAGTVIYPYADEDGVHTYAQVFRNGSIEYALSLGYEPEGRKIVAIVGRWFGNALRDALRAYVRDAEHLGVRGAVVLSVALLKTKGTQLASTVHSISTTRIEENRLDLPKVLIDDIQGDLNIEQIIAPTLDTLYQAYGVTKNNLIDDEGRWREGNIR